MPNILTFRPFLRGPAIQSECITSRASQGLVGNVSGFTPFEPSLGGKWVSLLKEAAPNVDHLGIVYNPEPGNNSAAFRKSIDEVANQLEITSIETPSGDSADIDRLIRSLKGEPNSGLVFLPDAITAAQRIHITALVAQCRLPAIYPLRLFCEAGGLMSYGVKADWPIAGAASYIDRILHGANPAELPVQLPTEFEFVVNQKTARQLGLQLPPLLLAQADDVIEYELLAAMRESACSSEPNALRSQITA
jgi:putative tryptophan/tyrosine transport system substrate-binding protein